MSEQDRFEDDLLFAMTRTGEGFGGEGRQALAVGGLARGRRLRRRRSATASLGGAVALALVGTGAMYLTGGTGGTGGSPATAPQTAPAAGGGTASVSATGTGTGTGTDQSDQGGQGGQDGAPARAYSVPEAIAVLRTLLPAGKVTGTGDAAGPLLFDDGKGGSVLSLSLDRYGEGDARRTENGCPDRKAMRFDACTSTALPGGGSLTVFQGYEYPDNRAETKRWFARLVGQDGRMVQLTEWNAPAAKGAPVSRPAPPLTPEQLTAVVTGKSWDRIVAGIPLPAPVKPRDTEEYGKDEILAITAGLLPAGLKQAETGGQPGFADFVVDDGKGKSLVQVNVQDGSHDNAVEQLFGNAERLPDGTRVTVLKQGGMWTVDTLHADGLRVVISAFNSAGLRTPATRATPALTVEQLKAVATAPQWKLKK
ncbi:hypothetical protein ACFVYP_37800 [Kitasatospora sp. NPDC058201]|uniref:hypothetical protein n=1 Tax=unclassified Kitasatospora TaxID=2633591 RepID=UPI00364FD5D9